MKSHGVIICFGSLRVELLWKTLCSTVIPWNIPHGIPWNLRGNFNMFSPSWNSMGYKTGTAILQDLPNFIFYTSRGSWGAI